ncbi:MAG: DUF63 family protein [Candidatus Aenigmarchaeota archaeon]|nr:DUF63 family protein [Candidatus Aenigmarchaeota archaeon]
MNFKEYLEFLLKPAIETGYTWDKTLTYGIILILAVLLIFKMLKKLKVKIDGKFSLAIFPFVIFGGVLRVLRDLGILTSFLFATPYIYFLVAFITIATLLISLLIEKRFRVAYTKVIFLTGFILFSLVIVKISPIYLTRALYVLAFFFPFLVLLILVEWKKENKAVTLIQTFDGIVTFVAINFFGYSEQHVLPTFFIQTFGAFTFPLIKIVAVVLALIAIDKFFEDREMKNFVKLCIAILAGGTSTRDFTCLVSHCSPS